MKTFKQFLEAKNWRDWPPDEDMYAQQDEDDFNANSSEKFSVSHSGVNYENPRDSDHFVLYNHGEEITQGSLPEIIARVQQIRKEYGF